MCILSETYKQVYRSLILGVKQCMNLTSKQSIKKVTCFSSNHGLMSTNLTDCSVIVDGLISAAVRVEVGCTSVCCSRPRQACLLHIQVHHGK